MQSGLASVTVVFTLAGMLVQPDFRSLEERMGRLGVRSVLILASQSVDESPVWSPHGNAIAVNVEGRWKEVDLEASNLIAGTWHDGEHIGVLEAPKPKPIRESKVRTWEKGATAGAREVVARDGTKVELLSKDLGTRLVIARLGSDAETVWKASMENCHSLALSPDGRRVAYICELNGVIVTNLAK